MLSSSVVCSSFTSSKNKKGIIKILVYISVIDINQIDVLFFVIIITTARGDLRRGFTRFDRTIIDFP